MQNQETEVGAGAHVLNKSDVVVMCDTNDGAAVDLELPELSNYIEQGKDLRDLAMIIVDDANNASANNINISVPAGSTNRINDGLTTIALVADGVSAVIRPSSDGTWTLSTSGLSVENKPEVTAIAAIADPATATTTDIANKVNEILAALKA